MLAPTIRGRDDLPRAFDAEHTFAMPLQRRMELGKCGGYLTQAKSLLTQRDGLFSTFPGTFPESRDYFCSLQTASPIPVPARAAARVFLGKKSTIDRY
jgi:hypothetical protein